MEPREGQILRSAQMELPACPPRSTQGHSALSSSRKEQLMCPAESSCCILATRHFTVPDKPRDRRHPPLTLSNTQREEFEVEARPQKRASTARRPPRPLHAQAGTSLSSTPFIYSHHPRPLPVPSSLSICLPSSTCILIFFATSLPLPLPTLPYPSRATPFRHNPGVCTTQCSAPWTG